MLLAISLRVQHSLDDLSNIKKESPHAKMKENKNSPPQHVLITQHLMEQHRGNALHLVPFQLISLVSCLT